MTIILVVKCILMIINMFEFSINYKHPKSYEVKEELTRRKSGGAQRITEKNLESIQSIL